MPSSISTQCFLRTCIRPLRGFIRTYIYLHFSIASLICFPIKLNSCFTWITEGTVYPPRTGGRLGRCRIDKAHKGLSFGCRLLFTVIRLLCRIVFARTTIETCRNKAAC